MLRIAAALFLLFAILPAQAAEQKADYATLLAAAKRGDAPIDWQALRFAYADRPDFVAIDIPANEAHKRMYAALNAKDYAGAIKEAETLLDRVWVDIDAHKVCDIAYGKLGDPAKAKPHHEAVLGLARSIRTGDGHTPQTAFTVISVPEEYSFLGVFGLKRTKQALIQDGGHAYDRLDVTDRDGKSFSLFFLIDRVLAAEARMLTNKK